MEDDLYFPDITQDELNLSIRDNKSDASETYRDEKCSESLVDIVPSPASSEEGETEPESSPMQPEVAETIEEAPEVSSKSVFFPSVRCRLSLIEHSECDEEPEQWKSTKEQCSTRFNNLLESYWSMMMVYIEHRRHHLKVKYAKVKYTSDQFEVGKVLSSEFSSLTAKATVDEFLQRLFAISDFALVETKSLRHRCMGCLADGYTVLQQLCADLRRLSDCMSSEPLSCDVEEYAKGRFLGMIEAKEKLVSVCETAKMRNATSLAAASLRLFLSP